MENIIALAMGVEAESSFVAGATQTFSGARAGAFFSQRLLLSA